MKIVFYIFIILFIIPALLQILFLLILGKKDYTKIMEYEMREQYLEDEWEYAQ